MISFTLLIKQSIFFHIGGYYLVLELVDKAFNVVDSHLAIFERLDSHIPEQ